MSHTHRQTGYKQASRQCSSASLLNRWRGWSLSLLAIGSPQTTRYSCGWLPRKRHSACDVLCSFQFNTEQWWEMNQPWLSLKGRAEQSSIKKSITCYRQNVCHIPLWHRTAEAALKAEYMLYWLWVLEEQKWIFKSSLIFCFVRKHLYVQHLEKYISIWC